MAKAKKQDLTAEEKLAQALVPEEDWPYEVPENWLWVRLIGIGDIVTGGTPSKKNAAYYGGTFPFIKPADLDNGRNVSTATEYLTDEGKAVARFIPKHSTAVCCIGTIGKSGFLEIDATTNQQINSIIPKYNQLYVYYFSCSHYFVNQLLELASATTISIVNKSKMETIKFPLPPLSEQQRIVTRIESLFAKLDQARDLVQSALDTFETRRAAILHKAFTGQLTASWRKENDVNFDTWEDVVLGDICVSIFDGDHMPPPKAEEGIPFLVISNINTGVISLNTTRFVPQEYFDNLTDTRKPKPGDILYSVTGSFGIPSLVETEEFFTFQRHIALLKPSLDITNSKYLFYNLQTLSVFNQAAACATGTAQKTVPIRGLRNIKIKLPSLYEQQEIVKILDTLLQKESTAQALTDTITQIDHLKKSILARAFRGLLGTNNPSEKITNTLQGEFMEAVYGK